MSRTEYAAAAEPHGPNPLRERGTFPDNWGKPPTPYDSPQRRTWIAAHCRQGGGSTRAMSPQQRLIDLLGRSEDPSIAREQARIRTRNALRQQQLQELRRRCP